jgi:peptidoglycan/xylan/chitin deacetylase (PgdA/CDA1 family)
LKRMSMVKTTACVAGLILAFAAFSYTRARASSNLVYHGVAVNTAVEQRQDGWWKEAQVQIDDEKATEDARPKILFHGNPTEKEIALTFDDGPHVGKVEELLGLLNQLDVKATFFVVGKMVEKHPELVRMEAAAGNEIADHSLSHVNLSKIPEDEVQIEYSACKDLLRHITGKDPLFCRPPGGQATPEVMRAAAKCDLTTAMWSDDPKDYANPGTDVILQRTLDKAAPGGIILLHEGVDETMQVLPAIVNTLRNEGYRFVTMSELAADSRHHSESGFRLTTR